MSKVNKPSFFEVSIKSTESSKSILSKGFVFKGEFKFEMLKSLHLEWLVGKYVDLIVNEYRKSDLKVISSNPEKFKTGDVKNLPYDKFRFTLNISVNGMLLISKGFRTLGFTNETRTNINLISVLEKISNSLATELADTVKLDENGKVKSYNHEYEGYEITKNYSNRKWKTELIRGKIYRNTPESVIVSGGFLNKRG